MARSKRRAQRLATYRALPFAIAIPVVAIVVVVGLTVKPPSHASSAAPASPPVTWCENGLPASPYTSAPQGAVTVPAGDNSAVNFSSASTTYWFAPGTHTLGTSQYGQIEVGTGDTYMGAPGAIIDGQNKNDYAFTGSYDNTANENITVEYLTIKDFIPMNGGGAVNADGDNGWTEKYDLMEDNTPGAAMMLGGNNVISDNCMTNNGEYGFNGYSYVDENYEDTFTGGATNITMTNNDISFNNTQKTDYGVEGGGKFWQNGNVVVTGNYVHDNIDSPGLWADTDNAGFLIQNNYFSNNAGPGLMYEISYNADITDNTFVDNAIVDGPTNPGFPTGAIYVSESGGDSGVASNYSGELLIQDNNFNDNWAGVVAAQNANRYSGDGQDPGTLDPPPGVDMQTWINTDAPTNCPNNLTETTPINYHSLCQWRVQNLTVENNQFSFNPSDAIFDGKCTEANSCGQNALFSGYSSTAAYPEFTICNLVSNDQNNHFLDNTYTGPWTFALFSQGNNASWSQWTTAQSNVVYSGDSWTAQDAGSTYNSTTAPTPTATPTPSPTATPTSSPSNAPSPTPTPTSSSAPTPVVGDINGDGTVNIVDLSILLSNWGTSDAAADLNHDGTVNIIDLSILLSHWGA